MGAVLQSIRFINLLFCNQGGLFPDRTRNMTGLRWLKLDRTKMCYLPEELADLKKLEEISVARNELTSLHGDLDSLPRLKSINASHNRLKDASIPSQLFDLEDLSTFVSFNLTFVRFSQPHISYRFNCLSSL